VTPSLVRRPTAGQFALDVGLAALVLGVCGLAAGASHSVLGGWVSAVLLAAGTGVRRLCPWAMVGLALLGGAVQLVSASANAASALALALLFATTGFDQDRWIRRAGLTAVVVASVGGGVAAGTHGLFGVPDHADLRDGLITAIQIAVVAGAAWLTGFVGHQRRVNAEVRIAERIARVELLHEQERTRIARDMHDVVAHTLAVVVAQAEGARYAMSQHPRVVERALRTIAETCRDSLGDVRRLLGELRGEPTPVAAGVPGDDALFERMRLAGLNLDVMEVGVQRPLAGPQTEVTRWVLTEALTNALKHGAAGEPVTLRRTWGDELEMAIANAVPAEARTDGPGRATGSPVSQSGFGWPAGGLIMRWSR
jgi:signal transduction histidine kinase